MPLFLEDVRSEIYPWFALEPRDYFPFNPLLIVLSRLPPHALFLSAVQKRDLFCRPVFPHQEKRIGPRRPYPLSLSKFLPDGCASMNVATPGLAISTPPSPRPGSLIGGPNLSPSRLFPIPDTLLFLFVPASKPSTFLESGATQATYRCG